MTPSHLPSPISHLSFLVRGQSPLTAVLSFELRRNRRGATGRYVGSVLRLKHPHSVRPRRASVKLSMMTKAIAKEMIRRTCFISNPIF